VYAIAIEPACSPRPNPSGGRRSKLEENNRMTNKMKNRQLWNAEPALWQLAQESTFRQPLPRHPQIAACFFGPASAPAVDLCTLKMRVSLWGPPDQLTLTLGKNDVWDRRRTWERPYPLGQVWAGAFAECNAGEPKDQKVQPGQEDMHYLHPQGGYHNPYPGGDAYPFPSPKPVGQAILLAPDFVGQPAPEAEIRCDDGTARVALHCGSARLEATVLTMMTRHLIAWRVRASGLQQPLALRLYRHRDVSETYVRKLPDYDYAADAAWNGPPEPPTSGAEGRFFWIRQRLPAEKTFPDGFEYVFVGLAPDTQPAIATIENQTGLGTRVDDSTLKTAFGGVTYAAENAAPGTAVTLTLSSGTVDQTMLLAIVTTAEAADPLAEAKRRLLDAEALGFDGLRKENAEWYREFYARREQGRIVVGDAGLTKARLPALMTSWRVPDNGSSQNWPTLPDPRRFEGDEVYPHMGHDNPWWHGSPCYNEIYETAFCVMNQNDRLEFYANLVGHWLEAARHNARDVFGLPGMFLAHGYHPPIKADAYTHCGTAWELCMEIPAQVMKPAWDIWDYGGDVAFLERRVYPALRDLADFYAAYVSKGEDGRYHVIPTVSAEHWGLTYRFARNRDSAAALSLFRWTLQRAAEAAELLGRDANRRQRWLDVAEKLAPYPTVETADGPVLTDVAAVNPIGVGYNFFGGAVPTLLADQIHLDSPPEEKALMLRTVLTVGGWRNRDVIHLLGAYPELRKGVPACLFVDAKPDEPLDTPEKLLAAVTEEPERLLNSRSGRIHLFPCVPTDATIGFREFQARGGFLVSAEMTGGQVRFVEITARRSTTCRLKNPWPGCRVAVRRVGGRGDVTVRSDCQFADGLVFMTEAGSVYRVVPADWAG